MKITVIGSIGYVGLVTATCFAEVGYDVVGVDVNEEKIKKLKQEIMPFYEPGMSELVVKNMKNKRLSFTTNLKKGIESAEIVFNCVGTPALNTGETELKYVKSVAKSFGKYLNQEKLFVNKSTVPVGTADLCKEIINKELIKRNIDIHFEIASNPEFLREGCSIRDFMVPDRIVCGVDSKKSKTILEKLYKPFTKAGKPTTGASILFTEIRSSELIKYASNCFLATKISFINEMANYCERVGANIDDIAKGIGTDPRIGSRFLHAGIGYGGSCFPKDIKSLIFEGKKSRSNFKILESVDLVNKKQRFVIINKLKKIIPDLKAKTIAIWGLAFKPKTDDVREAPSLEIVQSLQKEGCNINVYDPMAENNFKKTVRNLENINIVSNALTCLKKADALLILTEWNEFRGIDLNTIKNLMKGNLVFDGRNIYSKTEMEKIGLKYFRVG